MLINLWTRANKNTFQIKIIIEKINNLSKRLYDNILNTMATLREAQLTSLVVICKFKFKCL